MKKRCKLFGFRTHVKWKMAFASIYYLFCLTLIIIGLFQKSAPGSIPLSIIGLCFLIPALLASDFFLKRIAPIFWHRRKDADLFGFIIYILVFLIIALFNFRTPKENVEVKEENIKQEEKLETINGNLIVHFIDVGQGDATFIELPNNETILIDAGEKEYGKTVTNYISSLGYDNITYLIGTHPHSDHIGGLVSIIDKISINNMYMPKAVSTSSIYENLLLSIKDKGLEVKIAKRGLKVVDMEDLDVYFLSPTKENYNELNNYSAVLKIEYKDETFIFMGDAEKTIENDIKEDCEANVIKVSHHGSNTSSSKDFVNTVKPDYAIISVGKDNIYKLPDSKIVSRWKNVGAKVLRTDIDGNIIIKTNGTSLEVQTSN